MAVKISSATYNSTNATTKQTFSGASGENRFYGLNTIDWVTFENASGVVDVSFFVPNITTGDVFVLKGVNAETVLAHIIGNSVVLTSGSQIFTFGAIAGGESFIVKFATSDGTISGKDLTIHRTDDNSGLAIEATYLGNPTMPLTETPVNVAYVVPVIQLAVDTGVSSSDGITSNPLLSITNLVSDSTKVEYSTNGTNWSDLPKTTVTSTLASFSLPVTDSQTVTYNAGTIQVRQTYSVNGIQKIATGSNSAITIDRAKPIATLTDSIIATDTDSSSSYTTGDKIRMTFNEVVSLSSDVLTGILSSHTLGTSATILSVNAINGYATQFDITLGTSPTISATDVLTIGTSKATDKAGNTNDAVTFTVPTLPDITKPFMQSAVVASDGASVVITYSENLKNSSVTASDFLITLADNSTVTGTNAAISNATVTLTLSKKIGTGELSISYTDGTSHSIQDVSGNAATSQSLMNSITNNSIADVTAPTLVSATVNGASIVLTYNDTSLLDGTHIPSINDFSVATNGGTGVHPASLVVDGTEKKITLTLANAVSYGQSVALNYVDVAGDSTNAIQDDAGNDAASLTNQMVTNLTPIIDFTVPVISDACITDSSLVLTLTEVNSLSGTPLSTDFKVYKNGVANALTYSSTSPITYNTTAKTVTLTLNSAVVGTDAITIDYTRPSATSQRINDIANNSLAGFSGRAVSNATPHTLTSAITSASFIERAIDGSRYVALKGSGFSQLLDIGKGEIASASTDVVGRLDVSKIVWNTVSTANSTPQALSNSATSVPHVYLVSDTKMRVVLSDILWDSLTSSSNLLSAVDGAQDNVVITSGFLKDFAGNTSLGTLTATEGTFTLDEYHKSVSGTQVAPDAPTIYSSNIFLSGSGYFSGTNIKTNGGITVDGLASVQTLELSNLVSLANGGTLTNANNTGEVIVRLGNVDGVVAPATTGVSSTSTGTTTVIFSNNNSDIYQFFTLGDGIDKFVLASTSALPQISGGTFDVTKDKILLDVNVFKGFSQATTGTITSPTAITSGQFEIASSASANSGSIRLFFNDGSLYYDSDGSGGGAAPVKILEIGTPSGALTYENFGLVANS
jgi:uncharacterized repeat protein (TIGR02059 family)